MENFGKELKMLIENDIDSVDCVINDKIMNIRLDGVKVHYIDIENCFNKWDKTDIFYMMDIVLDVASVVAEYKRNNTKRISEDGFRDIRRKRLL